MASQINLLFTVSYAKFTRANNPHGSPILASLLGRENAIIYENCSPFVSVACSGIRSEVWRIPVIGALSEEKPWSVNAVLV
jgi:hypothetical protein